MRKVTFGAANSLDNFIARPDDSTDWLKWDEEVAAVTSAFWQTIDTVIMGRKTYEVAVRSGIPSYPGVRNIVFSRSMTSAPEVEVSNSDPATVVASLKQQRGKGICVMGGGQLAKALFEADLIDEVGLNTHPVLLGSGIPLFHPMPRSLELELIEHKRFQNGCLLIRYRVRHRIAS